MATCPKCGTFLLTATTCPKDGVGLIDDDAARAQGLTPRITERYEIQKMLGEGGMGTVYLALHRDLDRRVAIKILRKEGQNAQSLERFKREARASSLINHRHVVSIMDFGELLDGSMFYAMEHLDGKSLADAIDHEGPFSLERTLSIGVQLAKGLAAAHEKKVIHRDLKPDNVFLINSQEFPDFVKILDFGIAKLLDGNRLTKTGMVLGTPDYMSPEQATGQPADHRADIYALGILLYEMLVGQRPFMGDSFMQVLSQHLYAAPPMVRAMRTDIDIPEGCDEIIQACLAKRPENRYQSMEDILRAFWALPGAAELLPEPLLPQGTSAKRPNPPAQVSPAKSNTSPPSKPVPSLAMQAQQPRQTPQAPAAASGRMAQINPTNPPRPVQAASPYQRNNRQVADRVPTVLTTELPTNVPPRPQSIEEDQPTSAWTDPLPSGSSLPETLPPEVAQALARSVKERERETWSDRAPTSEGRAMPANQKTTSPPISSSKLAAVNARPKENATLLDGALNANNLPVGKANPRENVTTFVDGQLNASVLEGAVNDPPTLPPENRLVINTGRGDGKIINPAKSTPAPVNMRGNIPTLVDGALNKKDLMEAMADEDGATTGVGPNPMAPTSVGPNPLRKNAAPEDPKTSPAIYTSDGQVRSLTPAQDSPLEVTNEPTRTAAVNPLRAPSPAPTAPTPAAILEATDDDDDPESTADTRATIDRHVSTQDVEKAIAKLEGKATVDLQRNEVKPPANEGESAKNRPATPVPNLSKLAAIAQEAPEDSPTPQKSSAKWIGALASVVLVAAAAVYWFVLR